MNRNAQLIVVVMLVLLGGVTAFYMRPIDEATKFDFEKTDPDAPIPPKAVVNNPLPAPENPTKADPHTSPAIPTEGDVDLSKDGVRKYTALPRPKFFESDGLPSETQPINPLDFMPAPPALVNAVNGLVEAVEKEPKSTAALQTAILFLCRNGRVFEAVPYFDRYLAAGGSLKDLGEIVVSDAGKNAPGEPIGGGLEFYIRGLSMVGRFKDANEKQKDLEKLLPGYAESGQSLVFVRFYEFYHQAMVKRDPVEAMYALEKFNSVWPTGHYPELENQAASAFIRILADANIEQLEELLPQLNQVWPHLPSNTMQLIVQDLLKRGARPSPFMMNAGDPTLRGEDANPAALIRRGLHSLTRANDPATALKQAQRAVVLARELRIPDLELSAHWSLADIAHAAGDMALQVQAIKDAEELTKAKNLEGTQLNTSFRVAALYEQLADERKAMETYVSIHRKAKQQAASLTALKAMRGYSRLAAKYGRPTEVLSMLKGQLEAFENARSAPRLVVEPAFNLGLCYQRLGKVDEAATAFGKVLQAQNAEFSLKAYLEIGSMCLRDKNGAEAEKAFLAAQDIEKTTRSVEARWRALLGLARSRLAQKDLPGATKHINDALLFLEAQPPSVADFQQRRMLQDEKQDVWEIAINLALKEGNGTKVFDLAERCRNRALQDVLGAKLPAAVATNIDALKSASAGQKTVLYLSMPDALMIWVVSGEEIFFERVAVPQRQLFGEISALLKGTTQLPESGAQWKDVLAKSYDRLWKPIAKYIKPGERVCIVPHAMLHYAAFAALYDGEAFLVEKNELYYAPSAAAFVELRARGRGAITPVAVFDPLFSTAAGSDYNTTEGTRLAELFPGTRVFKGRDATTGSLYLLPPGTATVQLSAHAQFDPWLPSRSGFEVWRDGNPSLFTLDEALKLKLPGVQLFAFTAPPTAIQAGVGGDEAGALARALQTAGARNVLMPVWSIDHTPQLQLFTAFYQNLKANPDPVTALNAAQRGLLKSHPHPYGWAGFMLNGAGK